jgi:hypothetical protein
MSPRHLLRLLARMLPLLLFSLALPQATLSQAVAPGPAELAPEARARLAQAAGDTTLAPWQRDLMLCLAQGDEPAALDSPAAGALAGLRARASDATDGSWAQLVVGVREDHSAIYDPVRDRVVVFGGLGESIYDDVWALSLAGTPAWTLLAPTGAPPGARYGHSAIYDPERDCMVVFGGLAASNHRNDVWVLSLAGTPAWTALTPTGTPPGARWEHSAIYDPVRDRMVVFGGQAAGSSSYNDVWALSLAGTPAWTQLTPTATPPSVRRGHSAIYDPVRDRMVVFGGTEWNSCDDVWSLSLAEAPAWTQLTPTGTPPGARFGHTAIYDPVRDRMVVFGGALTPYFPCSNDVWSLSLGEAPAWLKPQPTGSRPNARWEHSAIYDPVRDRMVVFGGTYWAYTPGTTRFNDVWAVPLAGTSNWTPLNPSGTPPSERDDHSAVLDPVRNRMVVFGGAGVSVYNDVHALSLAGTPAWTLLAPTGTPPSARCGHTAIHDPVRDRVVVFGGVYGPSNTSFNEVWALSLAGTPAWTLLAPTGTPPSARYGHTAIHDPVRDRMVVFGGWDASSRRNDVWSLSLAGTPAWAALTPAGTPPSTRDGHSAIYDPVRDRMVVFGGWDASSRRNDVWSLSLAGTPTWAALTPSGTPPSARDGHSAIYDPARDRMVVFAGYPTPSLSNEVRALSLAGTPTWTLLAPAGKPPSARSAHSAIYDPVHDRMVIFGGNAASYACFNDVWALGWSTAVIAVGDPQARPLVSGLRPPVPNPTRGTTAVTFALAQAGRVQLGVYDVSGRLVRRLVDAERRAGVEKVVWNGMAESGARLQAGMYFVRLTAPGFRETRRVILLR